MRQNQPKPSQAWDKTAAKKKEGKKAARRLQARQTQAARILQVKIFSLTQKIHLTRTKNCDTKTKNKKGGLEMKAINFTPHEIVLVTEEGKIVIPSSGTVRLEEKILPITETVVMKSFQNPTWNITKMQIVDVPPFERDDYLIIVSLPVLQNLPKVFNLPDELKHLRPDQVTIVAPETGPESAVRDENGRIIGVRRFCVLA